MGIIPVGVREFRQGRAVRIPVRDFAFANHLRKIVQCPLAVYNISQDRLQVKPPPYTHFQLPFPYQTWFFFGLGAILRQHQTSCFPDTFGLIAVFCVTLSYHAGLVHPH